MVASKLGGKVVAEDFLVVEATSCQEEEAASGSESFLERRKLATRESDRETRRRGHANVLRTLHSLVAGQASGPANTIDEVWGVMPDGSTALMAAAKVTPTPKQARCLCNLHDRIVLLLHMPHLFLCHSLVMLEGPVGVSLSEYAWFAMPPPPKKMVC